MSIDGQPCMLEVLDTAGQEDYTVLRDSWVRDGEGFVLVYDITSRSSFSRIQRFHQHVQRIKGPTAGSPTNVTFTGGYQLPNSPPSIFPSSGAQVPVMLVGNKSDRITEREVSMQEGQALARTLGCDFVEASAKSCINVERAFYDVVRLLRRQRQQTSPRPVELKGPVPVSMGAIDPGVGGGASALNNPKPRHRTFRCVIL